MATQDTQATGITLGNTQDQSIGPPQLPRHVQARISHRRESMLQAAHPPPPPGSDSEGQEPTTAAKEQELIGIDVGDTLLEYLKDTDYVYLRQTTEDVWYELQEDPDADENGKYFYSISTGRLRTEGNIQRNVIDVTITDANNLQKNFTQRPDYWWTFIITSLVNLRNCTNAIHAHLLKDEQNDKTISDMRVRLQEVESALDNASQSQPTGSVTSAVYREKLTEVRRLTSEVGRLKKLTAPDVRSDPAFKALTQERDALYTERNDLKQQVEDLSRRGDELEEGPTYAQLKEDLRKEVESADWWADEAKASSELKDKYKAQADRYSIELHDYDIKYTNMIKNKDEDYDTLNNTLTEARREVKAVTDRLLQFDPNYKPYTLFRRERSHEPVRQQPPPPTQLQRLVPSQERASIDHRRSGYTPVREVSQLPFPHQNPLPPQHPNPYAPTGPAAAPFRPPPVPASTIGGTTYSYKLPELESFKGKADDDYERWREMAVAKCRTYPEDWQAVDYLKFRIQQEAYEHIRDVKAKHFLDYLEVLDGQYLTYDREADAETIIADGSLRYKSGQKFAEWKSKFTSCMRILKHKDATQIRYAREFMRPGLAIATTAGSHKDETIQSFLLRAQHIDQGHQQIDAGRKTTNPTTKTTSAVGRTPKSVSFQAPDAGRHNNAASTHTYKKMAFERSDKDKKRLAELKLCFKCGKDDHQMRHQSAPCRGKPFTPSTQIPALAAIYISALDAENEDMTTEDEGDLDDNDLVDDNSFYVNN